MVVPCLQLPGASIVTSVTFSYKNSTCGNDVTLQDTGVYRAAGMRTTGEATHLMLAALNLSRVCQSPCYGSDQESPSNVSAVGSKCSASARSCMVA